MDDVSTPEYEVPQPVAAPQPPPAPPAPYVPQTPPGAPPQGVTQAPKKKMPVWLMVLIVLAVLGLCTCGGCTALGIFGASQSGSDASKSTAESGSSGGSTAATEQTEAPAAEAPAAPAEQPATAEQPKTWVKVTTLSGKANKRSAPFEITGAPARLTYTVKGSSAMCAIYVLSEGTDLQTQGGFPEVMVSAAGSDQTYLSKSAGRYFLDVISANCSWTVVIEEEK